MHYTSAELEAARDNSRNQQGEEKEQKHQLVDVCSSCFSLRMCRYLAGHPELSELLLAFLGAVLEHHQRLQPQQRLHEQQLLQFAGRYFTQPNLIEVVARAVHRHPADAALSHVPGR